MFQPQHRQDNRARLWASQSDHSNAAASRRSRDGDYRIVEIHGAIVAVKLGAQPAAESEQEKFIRAAGC
jgi:hypothetical protein